jgi:hydrogenase-4 component E
MFTSINVILVLILLSALLSLGSSRMMALVKIMVLQGALISTAGLFLEQHGGSTHDGIFFFEVMLLVKGAFIPGLLYLAVTRVAIKREVEPLIGYHASLLAGLGLILLAVYITGQLHLSLPG